MNIVIRCHDSFYKLGLKAILHRMFTQELNLIAPVFSDYQLERASAADILVVMFRPGEHYICHPEMRINYPALMIGLVDKKHIPARGELPSCINNIVFIPHDAPVSQISHSIKQQWLLTQHEKQPCADRSCLRCPHKTFTEQQNRMVHLLLTGLTSRQIGVQMDICQKTVLAHRNALMNKFRLRSDCELLQFLTAVQEKTDGNKSQYCQV